MADGYVRISLQGTLPGGEVWSVNPAMTGTFANDTEPAQDELQTWATNIKTALPTAVGQQLGNVMSSNAAISNVRVARYNGAGKLDLYAEAPLTAPLFGTGAQTAPGTTALALSLYTSRLGRSGRGRIYWPALRPPIDQQSGRFTTSALGPTLSDFSLLLQALEDAAPASFGARVGVTSKVLGATLAVTQLRLGDVFDSQRRRKDDLQETYVSLAY